jgi:hypothetical protein
LNDYRRVDIGFSKVFIDNTTRNRSSGLFKDCKELALGLEIFNLFNNQKPSQILGWDVYLKINMPF